MRSFFLHLIQIGLGIGASAACVLFLHLLGLSLIRAGHLRNFASSPRAAFLGAAVTMFWCSYGLRLDFTLPTLLALETGALLILLFVRRSLFLTLPTDSETVGCFLKVVGLFIFFYTLSYCYLVPPASDGYLPIVTAGNNDIFNYINCTRYLQFLGPSNLTDYSFRTPFGGAGVGTYDQTPAAFYGLSAASAFFDGEPIRAAMPVMFGTVALVGCAIVGIVRSSFALPKPVCVAIATVTISGPFFRYNIGHYFLAQTLGMAIVLFLLAETARLLTAGTAHRTQPLFLHFLPFHIVLCFTYPVLSVISIVLQSGFVLLYCFFKAEDLTTKNILYAVKETMSWVFALAFALSIAWLSDPWHGFLNLRNLAILSKLGANGWPLDLISPIAMLGLPPMQISSTNGQIAVAIMSSLLLLLIGFLLRHRESATTSAHALYALACLSYLLYFAYFLLVGPTYQQWKLAVYLPLTLSFAIPASVVALVLTASERADGMQMQLFARRAILLVCISVVATNLILHFRVEPPPETFTSDYANLKQLENLPGAKSVSVDMATIPATFLSVYYVRNKPLQLLSQSYYPRQHLKIKDISPQKPLFFEGQACEQDEYRFPLARLGCVFLREPTIRPEQLYQFNHRYLELADVPGLGGSEAWGRWSNGKKIVIALRVNSEELAKQPHGYINFDLSPYVPVGAVTIQQVSLVWGNGNIGYVSLSERSWVSLPVHEQDWPGGAVRTLSIEFEFPNAISPKQVDAGSSDSRQLAVGFVALAWNAKPMGKIPGDLQ